MSISRSRRGFTLLDLIVVMLLMAILVGLLLVALNRERRPVHTVTMDSLKNMALAIHNANDVHKALPPLFGHYAKDGPALASVHVHLMPFLEQTPIYLDFAAGKGNANAVV